MVDLHKCDQLSTLFVLHLSTNTDNKIGSCQPSCAFDSQNPNRRGNIKKFPRPRSYTVCLQPSPTILVVICYTFTNQHQQFFSSCWLSVFIVESDALSSLHDNPTTLLRKTNFSTISILSVQYSVHT